MNIKIKLDNPDYCEDCPCLLEFQGFKICNHYGEMLMQQMVVPEDNIFSTIRPDKCKTENDGFRQRMNDKLSTIRTELGK